MTGFVSTGLTELTRLSDVKADTLFSHLVNPVNPVNPVYRSCLCWADLRSQISDPQISDLRPEIRNSELRIQT